MNGYTDEGIGRSLDHVRKLIAESSLSSPEQETVALLRQLVEGQEKILVALEVLAGMRAMPERSGRPSRSWLGGWR